MKIGNRNFDIDHECYIMGILNVRRIPFQMAVSGMTMTRQRSMWLI